MSDEKRRPLSDWIVEREELVDGASKRYPVGDFTVWPNNGTLRLAGIPRDYVVFPKFKEGSPKGSRDVEPGKFVAKVSMAADPSAKGWLAPVGELELDEDAGTGTARFNLFPGSFVLTRREARAA